MVESRSGVAWGRGEGESDARLAKRQGEMFAVDGDVCYLDCGDGFLTYMSKLINLCGLRVSRLL